MIHLVTLLTVMITHREVHEVPATLREKVSKLYDPWLTIIH